MSHYYFVTRSVFVLWEGLKSLIMFVFSFNIQTSLKMYLCVLLCTSKTLIFPPCCQFNFSINIHNKIKIEMLLPSLLLVSMMAGSSVSLSLMVSGYNRNLTKLQLTPTFEVRFLN